MLKRFIATNILLLGAASTTAGVLKQGVWVPSSCGSREEAPFIDTSNADAYNASVKAINAWQKTASAYDDCLVKEANTDSAVIVKTVTDEQGKLKEIVKKINDELNTGREFLDQKRKGSL
ncbi:conserved exported hypothetical protein [Crenothrix polyspora]|uniref:Uncharacterized protein n=1 Tax=Crenothrix polyspora TaxID=360316 RepID=A0A1R4H7Y6_9GAMM|nr:hypothetical protein [Crenothrix polyspora]SJM92388.1 conserved exported hypothetical protein [Crenothrix polyspora]